MRNVLFTKAVSATICLIRHVICQQTKIIGTLPFRFLLVLASKTIQDNLGQVFTPNTCLLRTTCDTAQPQTRQNLIGAREASKQYRRPHHGHCPMSFFSIRCLGSKARPERMQKSSSKQQQPLHASTLTSFGVVDPEPKWYLACAGL